jgi:hypothetical protein
VGYPNKIRFACCRFHGPHKIYYSIVASNNCCQWFVVIADSGLAVMYGGSWSMATTLRFSMFVVVLNLLSSFTTVSLLKRRTTYLVLEEKQLLLDSMEHIDGDLLKNCELTRLLNLISNLT